MKLEEIENLLLKSERADWSIIPCESFGNGPSYKNKLIYSEVLDDDTHVIQVDSHSNIAVFKPNVGITMAFGLVLEEEVEFEWLDRFESNSASSYFMDIFYHNALVHREKYLLVDGVECILPYPISDTKRMKPKVSLEQYAFIGLLHLLEADRVSKEKYDSYFEQSGIVLIKGDL